MEDVRPGLPGLVDRNAVVVVDDAGAPHPGMIHRWGSAFVEIDLDEYLRGDFVAGSHVQLRGAGVGSERTGRIVRSGRRLVVQLANARERRAHVRVPFHRPIRWRLVGEVDWRWGRSEDLSGAGIRLLLDEAPARGSRIELQLETAPDDQISVEGETLGAVQVGRWQRTRVRFGEAPHRPIAAVVDRLAKSDAEG